MVLISVIVPVYNTGKYLPNCLESLLCQDLHDYEIILIDDGSRDESGKICDKYVSENHHVRVLHKENEGVYKARLDGISLAMGEWITFVDSDNCLPQHALSELFAFASPDVNIILGNFSYNACLTAEEYRKSCIIGKEFSYTVWGKLYRCSLLKEYDYLIPKEIRMGEDMLMNIAMSFFNTKDVIITNRMVYHYLQHEESISHVFKRTFNYESLFYRYLDPIIPSQVRNKYVNILLDCKIRALKQLFREDVYDLTWFYSSFYQGILKELDQYGYKKYNRKNYLYAKYGIFIWMYFLCFAIVKSMCTKLGIYSFLNKMLLRHQ